MDLTAAWLRRQLLLRSLGGNLPLMPFSTNGSGSASGQQPTGTSAALVSSQQPRSNGDVLWNKMYRPKVKK